MIRLWAIYLIGLKFKAITVLYILHLNLEKVGQARLRKQVINR